jgi:anti-sigma regulatory factor (Ser/Thr protein kinase)
MDAETFVARYQQRCQERPYCDRRVHVTAVMTNREARYTVRDEGDGFDRSRLPDMSDPKNLEQLRERGLVLIYAFMDQVQHNEMGNEVMMVKRRQ